MEHLRVKNAYLKRGVEATKYSTREQDVGEHLVQICSGPTISLN